MKIYANQLPNQLNQGLAKCFMIFGDEPFQVNEARQFIKDKAKSVGFEEFIRLSDDDQFDWQDLQQECLAMSLFSSTKLIELELTSNKIGKVGSDTLKAIADELSTDTVLVLFGSKLEAAQTKSAWFKRLSEIGIYIPVYEIEGPHLQRWLQQQLVAKKMSLTPDAQAFLLNYTAGNLLACSQELDKLKLAQPNSPTLTLEMIETQVLDQSKYTVFQLADALWENQPDKCLTILSRLKMEAFEPNIILWALQKELNVVWQLQQNLKFGENTKATFDAQRIWKSKQATYTRAMNTCSPALISKGLQALSDIDKGLKYHTIDCPYTLFSHVCLLVNGFSALESFELPIQANLA